MDENSKKTALRETLQSLRTPGELYVIMSGATKLPFVVCNPETFDDEILLYHREEDAKNKAKELTEAHYLAGVAKLVDDQLLASFLTWHRTLKQIQKNMPMHAMEKNLLRSSMNRVPVPV